MGRLDRGDKLQRQDTIKMVRRYEEMLQNDETTFIEQHHYEHIIEFYEDNLEFDKALVVTEAALEQHPYSVYFLVKRAQFLFEGRQALEALSLLEHARILSPSELEVSLLQAEILSHQGSFGEAEEVLMLALDFADVSDKVDIYLAFADIYEAWKKSDKVLEAVSEALKCNPTHEDALLRMDYTVDFLKKYERSINIHKNIIDQFPYCYQAWYNLGNAYYGLGKYEEAIDSYDYATAINEDYEQAYRDCGDAHFELGRFEKAIREYKLAIETGEADDEILFNMALCWKMGEKYDIAEEYFKKAIHINNNYAEAHFHLAEIYLKDDHDELALKHYKLAVSNDEQNIEYLLVTAAVYAENGDFEKAYNLTDSAIEVDQNAFAPHYHKVRLLMAEEEFEEALTYLEESIIDPDASLYTYAKAICLIVLGKKQEGALLLQEALIDDFNSSSIFLELLPDENMTSQIHDLIAQVKSGIEEF